MARDLEQVSKYLIGTTNVGSIFVKPSDWWSTLVPFLCSSHTPSSFLPFVIHMRPFRYELPLLTLVIPNSPSTNSQILLLVSNSLSTRHPHDIIS